MRVTYAGGCHCPDPWLFPDEPRHCVKCGHGPFTAPRPTRVRHLRRVPWDLGALQRAGGRVDLNLENVVWLDRLRDRWMVPPVPTEAVGQEIEEQPLTPTQKRVLSFLSAGMSREQVANVMGVRRASVDTHLHHIYQRLGIVPGQGLGASAAVNEAIEWWRDLHEGELAA